MSLSYHDFLATKAPMVAPCGLDQIPPLPDSLKSFQRDIVAWALRRGRGAIFAGTGLGKTLMQLVWAQQVADHTRDPVILLAPLAVAQQTVVEARKFNIPSVEYASDQASISSRIVVTNYDRIHLFDPQSFVGIVLDESSIIKAHDSKTRATLIECFRDTPWRLCCTATPAPNDYVELGNHAEFLGVMTEKEMLSMFFVHDGKVRAAGSEGQDGWRLKRHATKDFWRWLASWAVVVRDPNEIGYDEPDYVLPPLTQKQITVKVAYAPNGTALFPMEARTLSERIGARKSTQRERIAAAAQIVNAESDKPWLVWCNLNSESEALVKVIPGAEQVTGSEDRQAKSDKLLGFICGKPRVLVSKPTIAGFGLNYQHCSNMVFVGLNDSFEQLFQAKRRCWRFGQTRPVTAYLISSEIEGAVLANLERKEADYEAMSSAMAEEMRDLVRGNLRTKTNPQTSYKTERSTGDKWEMRLGDAVEEMRDIADGSVHFSLHSPPFASLYTFSDSPRDVSNSSDDKVFWGHYRFVMDELFRVTMPGRLCAIHCMQLPTSKLRDGFIGLRDFRGEIIRQFQRSGFYYHSEICIRKDPVSAMQRSKSIGLLHKQVVKDSSLSRQAVADYVVVMRKPGDNPEPVAGAFDRYYGTGNVAAEDHGIEAAHIAGSYSVQVWQRYAEPIWMDIAQSDVLSNRLARAEDDERHIAPLQLTVIRRCYQIWTNPGDVVLSPFAGIGSEGYVAIEMGRRFIGVELKESYYRQALDNLRAAERATLTGTLFDIRGGSK
jgi:DNA modification methylase